MINVFLLIVGCFLDTGTALLVLSPLLLPIAKQIGVDPIHFGVIVVMNLTIGGFHPPFGLNIFVFQALFKTPSNILLSGAHPVRRAGDLGADAGDLYSGAVAVPAALHAGMRRHPAIAHPGPMA